MKDNMPSARDNMSEIKGVVIPLHPTWDKLTALWIIFKIIGRQLQVVSYSSTDDKDPVLVNYRDQGYYLLDVGGNKYQKRKTGSAVETVCNDFCVDDPTLLALVAVANFNNRKGNLKEYNSIKDPAVGEEWQFDVRFGEGQDKVESVKVKSSRDKIVWSVVWLLREAYKVGIDTNLVIKHVHDMLDAWYQVSKDNLDQSRWDYLLDQNATIKKIWVIFGNPKLRSNKGGFILPTFSLPWLVWSLVVIGKDQMEVTFDRIEEEVRWWVAVQKAVFKIRAEAKNKARLLTNRQNIAKLRSASQIFELQQEPDIITGYFRADEIVCRELWPQPADPDVFDELLGSIFGPEKLEVPKFGCLVLRNPYTKGVAIIARQDLRLDFGKVYARLVGLERQKRGEEKGKETKVWYLDRKGERGEERHWLLNGSENWPLPPTILNIPTILEIVWKSAKRFK